MHKKHYPAFIVAMVGLVGGFFVWFNTKDDEPAKTQPVSVSKPVVTVTTTAGVTESYQTAVDNYYATRYQSLPVSEGTSLSC